MSDVALTVILTLLIIANIIGNCLVCFVIKTNQDMRTPINYLLVNLAISDITFAAFVAPNHVLKKLFTHPDGALGSNICKFLTSGNMAWVGAASSSVTLVVIAIERYYTVMCPIGSRRKLNKRVVKIIICGCWIFALALNSPMISVTTFDDESGDCKWDWPEQWMGVANETTWLVLLACIPLTIMTGLYSSVVHSLWFKRNDDQELAYRQKGVLRVRKRVTLSVITVSAIFGICWITGLLIYVLSYYDVHMFGEASYAISDTLFMFNSAVNPLVYSLLNDRFKRKIKAMFCSRCTSRVHTSSESASIELPKNPSRNNNTAAGYID
ncbi:substance-K receptor-like [Stylophora pistillata]|uniref:Substance-K receptor n=1 Tax=Stylophora pistillata TaxID=50429 RepID=A0A2B4RCY2_STYPI|nr:substance-K receptor-like [Stylophora pistillata]XP_022806401.1 substance-K receptor-like [Stylophora pistillata]XP_022806402.1 substance-K receptor-like [Stylophora pistillata]PFX15511.1 Substance-K receptor [Stylophora pistillata]